MTMFHLKEVITAVGTLGIAAGLGVAMQVGAAAKERYGVEGRPTAAFTGSTATPIIDKTHSGLFLEVDEIEQISSSDVIILTTPAEEDGISRISAPEPSSLPDLDRDTLPTAEVRAEDCVMTATAKTLPGAMVNLTMSAPCAVNERLTVHHHGMMFTLATDAEGSLKVTVPALKEQAVFILAFSNGDGAVAHTQVTDLDDYDRVAVHWRGQAGFQLHAREFGAGYGEPGHIWSGGASDIDSLIRGEHGFLMPLGDISVAEPRLAEIYTFPSRKTQRDGPVYLSVEAEVTPKNCGLEIEAETIEITDGGKLITQDLILAVPGCDAVGSFLVLNNLVSDLKVASN